MPFYVPPEQMMKDRADYARKGIARGRSLVAFSVVDGIVLVAENAFRTLYKICEIYDRIAFAGVGKYNEFEMLRVAGVRQADLKGYSFAREDVNARALANAYGQTLGQVFTHEMKPYEVEILVAQVGESVEDDELYHILYDGTVMDEEGSTVLGGQAEEIARGARDALQRASMDAGAAIRLGASVLAGPDTVLSADQLEVAHPRPHASPAGVPPHQRRRADRHPRGRLSRTRRRRASSRRGLPVAHRAQERAEHRDREQRRRHPAQAAPAAHDRRLGTGVPPVAGRGEGGVDLVGQEHVAGVGELVLGDVHVDPCHVAHGEPVGALQRPAQLRVDALGLEPGGEHPGPERARDAGQGRHPYAAVHARMLGPSAPSLRGRMPAPLRLLTAALALVTGSVLVPIAAPAASAADPARAPEPVGGDVLPDVRLLRDRRPGGGRAAPDRGRRRQPIRPPAAPPSTALTDSLRRAGSSAERAARAATANGVPDVENGKALTRELRILLTQASKTYAAQSSRAGSKLPVEPKKLSAAAKKIGTDLGKGLSAQGAHAKRLQKLDHSNAMGGAVTADPTCAAAANAAGATVPAQPAAPGTGTP